MCEVCVVLDILDLQGLFVGMLGMCPRGRFVIGGSCPGDVVWGLWGCLQTTVRGSGGKFQ